MVQQFVYNNVYIKFATMYYIISSSLYQTALSHWERGWIYIDQFFESSFCPIEETNKIGNDLNSENIKVLWKPSFVFSW